MCSPVSVARPTNERRAALRAAAAARASNRMIARRCYTHCAEPMLPCRHSCMRVEIAVVATATMMLLRQPNIVKPWWMPKNMNLTN